MSIILSLIDERNNKLLEYDEKKEKRELLLRQLEELDKEVVSFDKNKILAELEELTECAVKLGLIEDSKQDELPSTENQVITG